MIPGDVGVKMCGNSPCKSLEVEENGSKVMCWGLGRISPQAPSSQVPLLHLGPPYPLMKFLLHIHTFADQLMPMVPATAPSPSKCRAIPSPRVDPPGSST